MLPQLWFDFVEKSLDKACTGDLATAPGSLATWEMSSESRISIHNFCFKTNEAVLLLPMEHLSEF